MYSLWFDTIPNIHLKKGAKYETSIEVTASELKFQ